MTGGSFHPNNQMQIRTYKILLVSALIQDSTSSETKRAAFLQQPLKCTSLFNPKN